MKECKLGHGRMSRWILALQNYNLNWEFVPGKQNIVPDIISRTDFEGNSEGRRTNEFKILNIIQSDKNLIRIIKSIKDQQLLDA